MRSIVKIAVLCSLSTFAWSDDVTLAILEASTGSWEGELYYLDYQSGQRFGIPMSVDAEMTPDNATLIRKLTFTDPGNLVYAVNVVTVERESGELVEAYFRERRAAELLRYAVTESRYEAEHDWRVVYEQEGIDDGRPARIRHTIVRKGELMTSTKEVRFLDGDDEFFLRNGMEVRRLLPD